MKANNEIAREPSFIEKFSKLVETHRRAECVAAYLMASMGIYPLENDFAIKLGDNNLTNEQSIKRWLTQQHLEFLQKFDVDQFSPLADDLIALSRSEWDERYDLI